MTPSFKCAKRPCPVCASTDEGEIFVDKNIRPEQLTNFSFSSRKIPEFFSHKLIYCPHCKVIFAPEIPSPEFLQKAYSEADFDTGDEAECAASTYYSALKSMISKLERHGSALEIGAGTGVFLRYLQRCGFSHVKGIEPSLAAIKQAPTDLSSLIDIGMFDKSNYEEEGFSFICCFQTLEHVSNPKQLIQDAFSLLEPGGMIALVTHNYSAWLNRILNHHSPIVDIEHLQLFHPNSLQLLLTKCGFDSISISSIKNSYRILYWIRFMPGPKKIKQFCVWLAKFTGFGRIKLGINVGNILIVARKPLN